MISLLLAPLLLLAPDGLVENTRFGLRMQAPPGWVSRVMPYPQVVGAFKDGRGGEMVLTVEATKPGDDLGRVVARNRSALEKMGWQLRRTGAAQGAARLGGLGTQVTEAEASRGQTTILQLYAILGDHAFVLTLAAPGEKMENYARQLYRTWKTMTFEGGSEPEEPTVDPGAGLPVRPEPVGGRAEEPNRP